MLAFRMTTGTRFCRLVRKIEMADCTAIAENKLQPKH